MAASKEAIAIVLDVGPHMEEAVEPGKPPPLKEAKESISMIVQRKIFSESKDEVTLILCGSEDTRNNLADTVGGGEYQNIYVLQPLKLAGWSLLEMVQDVQSTSENADIIDAIVVALDVLHEQTKGQKFGSRRVLLFSNFGGRFNASQASIIAEGMKNNNLTLTVVSPFDLESLDNSGGMLKISTQQRNAIKLVNEIIESVDGEAYTFSEALPALTYFQKRNIQSAAWNATLEMGPDLLIPVTAYIKITELKPKSWKQAVSKRQNVLVLSDTTLHKSDDAETEVKKEDTVVSYRFGTTLVPFTEDDKAGLEAEKGDKGYRLLGFTSKTNIKPYYYMGEKVYYVIAKKDDKDAQEALSAFIQALHQTEMVAIVRYAYSSKSSPRLGFLAPLIKEKFECFTFIQLPYMEDMRNYTFAPLDRDKKHLPTKEQLAAVDDLIQCMDLSTADVDEEGQRKEALKSSETNNLFLQRLYQCLCHRALEPDSPLPEIPPHLSSMLCPPTELFNLAKPVFEKMQKLFSLKRNIPEKETKADSLQTKSDKPSQNGEPESKKPRMEANTADKSRNNSAVVPEVKRIGTVNPTKDFLEMVSKGVQPFSEICRQLQDVILKFFSDLSSEATHTKAVNCLKVYRETCIEKEDPVRFNQFLTDLKSSYSATKKVIWELIIKENVKPISKVDCFKSSVTEKEADDFVKASLENSKEKEEAEVESASDDDDESLLANV